MKVRLYSSEEIHIRNLGDSIFRVDLDIYDCNENRQALTDALPLKNLLEMYDKETIQFVLKDMGYN